MRRYKIMRKTQGKTHKKNEKIKYSWLIYNTDSHNWKI